MKNVVLFSGKGKEEDVSKKKDPVKEIANAIAAGAHVQSFQIGKHTTVVDTGILFLGSEADAKGKIDKTARKILSALTPDGVKLVVVFTVAKTGNVSVMEDVKSILGPKGVKVSDEEFKISSEKNKDFPSEADLQKAREFASEITNKNKFS